MRSGVRLDAMISTRLSLAIGLSAAVQGLAVIVDCHENGRQGLCLGVALGTSGEAFQGGIHNL
jgi:hypothetical protein